MRRCSCSSPSRCSPPCSCSALPINGARRWISLGPAVFQPSELAKLALAIWAAAYLSRRKAPRTLKQLWRPIGLVACVFAVLLVLEPDLGTTIAIALMLGGILIVSGTPVRVLGSAFAIASAAGFAAIWMKPYSRARFFSFLHPTHDAAGTGYQILQAQIGMGSGHLFGVGLGQGVQKIFYLPEAHTDMMLANIGEELGLLGVTAVIARLCALRLRRAGHRGAVQGPVRQAPRHWAHRADLRTGVDQHPRRDGERAPDRDSAALPLLRRLEPRRSPRRRRDSP